MFSVTYSFVATYYIRISYDLATWNSNGEKLTNKLGHGKTHLRRKVSREDVAKVSCGGHKSDLVSNLERRRLLDKREIGVEIVNDLSKDSRKVDRVYGTELQSFVGIGVPKHGLDDILFAIISEWPWDFCTFTHT